MAQQGGEKVKPRRPLALWSPLYSNYFAYSSGDKNAGIDLYRMERASNDAEMEAFPPRGSITDRYPPVATESYGNPQQSIRPFADNSPAHSVGSTTPLAAPLTSKLQTTWQISNSGGFDKGAAAPPTTTTTTVTGGNVGIGVSGGGGAGVGGSSSGGGGGGGGGGEHASNIKENPFQHAGPDFSMDNVGPASGATPMGTGGAGIGVSAAGAETGAAGGALGVANAQPPAGMIAGTAAGISVGVSGGGVGGNVVGGVGSNPGIAGSGSMAGAPSGNMVGIDRKDVLDNAIPFSGGGGPVFNSGGGNTGGMGLSAGAGLPDFPGQPLGVRRTSSTFSEPGNSRSVAIGSPPGMRTWRYQMEGKTFWWQKAPKLEDQYVGCMRWFPHSRVVGRHGMQTADIRMLAVGYLSGKVSLIRFSEERGHGQSILVSPAADRNRPCTAVAWDLEKPSRLAVGWTKHRQSQSLCVFDINYVREWQAGRGAGSAQAATAAAKANTAAAGMAMGSMSAASAAAAATAAGRTASASAAFSGAEGMGAASRAGAGGYNTGKGVSTAGSGDGLGGPDYMNAFSGGSNAGRAAGLVGSFGSARSGGGIYRGGSLAFGERGAIGRGDSDDEDEGAGENWGGGRAGAGHQGMRTGGGRAGNSIREGGGGDGAWPIAKTTSGWDSSSNAVGDDCSEHLGSVGESVTSVAWVPQHNSLLFAGSKMLKAFDLRQRGGNMRCIEAHKGGMVSGIAVRTIDPRVLATWSETPGEAVKIWDMRKIQGSAGAGKTAIPHFPPVATLLPPGGLQSSVIDVAWSPTRVDVIATVHTDDPFKICLWDLQGNLVRSTPSDYRYARDPICSMSWQPHGVKPRVSRGPLFWNAPPTGSSATAAAPADSGVPDGTTTAPGGMGGGVGPPGGGINGVTGNPGAVAEGGAAARERRAYVIAAALAEDRFVAVKFPHRLLTTSKTRFFLNNIGLMERCPVTVSPHGDVLRAQGCCAFVGSAERSGFSSWLDEDAMTDYARRAGLADHVLHARRRIACSPKLPNILEIMKWRAQAGYMNNPEHNSKEIFARELADEMEASTDMINSTTLVVTAMPVSSASSAAGGGCGGAGNATAGSPTAALGTAASAVNSANRAVADKRSACRLWRWVARIDGLCEERRKREETEGFTVDGGVGGGVGVAWPSTEIAGTIGAPETQRSGSSKKRAWGCGGLADAGVLDLLAEEFETAAATSEEPYAAAARANTSRRRHPTLGCDIFSSPGRDSALRACGWGLRPEGVNEIVGGGISGGGGDIRGRDGGDARSGVNSRGELTSGDRHLRSCPGVPDGLGEAMIECEEMGLYERSAALAVFHGDLRAAVKALKRASEAARKRKAEEDNIANAAAAAAATTAAAATAAAVGASAQAAAAVGSSQGMNPNAMRGPFGHISNAGATSGGGAFNNYNLPTNYGSNTTGRRGSGMSSAPPSPPFHAIRLSAGGAGAGAGAGVQGSVGGITPAIWTDASALEQLLDMMGMCIAGFHPRPPRPSNPQDDRQEQMHEEDQWQWELWNSKANELLERKELHGIDAPGAYLRACCVFLSCVLNASTSKIGAGQRHSGGGAAAAAGGVTSSWGSIAFEEVLSSHTLSLADRTAVACMFLPQLQLEAFLNSEADRYVDGGLLEGVLLVGMAPRGIELLQTYVERTGDTQTASLVASRAALMFPQSWEEERMLAGEWVEAYRRMLHKWQFWVNSKLVDKYWWRAQKRIKEKPLSEVCVARLEAIKARHMRRVTQEIEEEEEQLRQHALLSSSSNSGRDARGAKAGSFAENYFTENENMYASVRVGGDGGGARVSSSNGRGSVKPAGGRSPGDAKKNWYKGFLSRQDLAHGNKAFDEFGGGVVGPGDLRVKCNYCGAAVPQESRRNGQRGSTAKSKLKSIVRYCSCRKPLPRCYICLDQIGTLNPETEAVRQQFAKVETKGRGITGGGGGGGGAGAGTSGGMVEGKPTEQSQPPSLGLDTWFDWCNTCKHVGHTHHLNEWFETHEECGVQGCRCRCRSVDSPSVPMFSRNMY